MPDQVTARWLIIVPCRLPIKRLQRKVERVFLYTRPVPQISEKYGLVYVVTKLGLLFVYDLESGTAVFRNRISPDPIFLACGSESRWGCALRFVVLWRG